MKLAMILEARPVFEDPDEGVLDTARRWGRGAALGAALAGTSAGLTGCSGGSCDIPSSAQTSPDAASYLPADDPNDYTSPDAGSYVPPPPVQKRSQFQQIFHPPRQAELRRKANILRQNKLKQGTFVHGELQR